MNCVYYEFTNLLSWETCDTNHSDFISHNTGKYGEDHLFIVDVQLFVTARIHFFFEKMTEGKKTTDS